MVARDYHTKKQELIEDAVNFLKATLPPGRYTYSVELRLRYHLANSSPRNFQQKFEKWMVDNFGTPVLVDPNATEQDAREIATMYVPQKRSLIRDESGRFYKKGE